MASNIGQGTRKLYYEDAYRRSFEARVISCEAVSADRYAVVLDQTAFFPEEGGQSPDRGILRIKAACPDGAADAAGRAGFAAAGTDEGGDVPVLDVQIREGVITHITDREMPEGSVIFGEIDFAHRFSNMQQHSAEHIFSGLVHSRCGLENVGFHLSDSEVTMDYSGVIDERTVSELEWEVNRAIWKNIASEQRFPTAEELEHIEYRSKIEIDGQVRLIIYPGYDVCACCAPHVARTGEIGLFKVISVQHYKGGVRVHMLAGDRAFAAFAKEHAYLTETARFLSTAAENVPERVRSMKEEIAAGKRALSEAGAAALAEKVRGIPEEETNVCLFTKDLDPNVIRKTVNDLMGKHAGICAVFDGDENGGYRYILGSADAALLKNTQERLKKELSARGGGKPPMMQGSVAASPSAIEALIRNTLSV